MLIFQKQFVEKKPDLAEVHGNDSQVFIFLMDAILDFLLQ